MRDLTGLRSVPLPQRLIPCIPASAIHPDSLPPMPLLSSSSVRRDSSDSSSTRDHLSRDEVCLPAAADPLDPGSREHVDCDGNLDVEWYTRGLLSQREQQEVDEELAAMILIC